MTTSLHVVRRIISFIDCEERTREEGYLPTLSAERFRQLSDLLDIALDQSPNDSLFWFWRGWADQKLEVCSHPGQAHPSFNRVKSSYLKALEIEPNHGPASMMLTVLHLEAAKHRAAERAVLEHGFSSWDEILQLAQSATTASDSSARAALPISTEELHLARSAMTASDSESSELAARKELARKIAWEPKTNLASIDLVEVRKYARIWHSQNVADIIERVYRPKWIYEGVPISAFYTGYIGWLETVKETICALAPEEEKGRLLYELTDAWDDCWNQNLRGEFYSEALDYGLDDPVSYMDCVVKGILDLSEAAGNSPNYETQGLVRLGIRWVREPSHWTLPQYPQLKLRFATALVAAAEAIGTPPTMAAIVEGVEIGADTRTNPLLAARQSFKQEPSDLTLAVLSAIEGLKRDAAEIKTSTQSTEQAVKRLYDLLYESIDRFEHTNNREAEAERFAERAAKRLVWIEQIVRYFDGDLKQAPLDFQRDVIVGEALFDYCKSTGQDNYALVVFHWGKLAEIWLRRSLLVPFGRWLDSAPEPPSLLQYGSQRSPLEPAEVDGNRGRRTWEVRFRNKKHDDKWDADDLLEVAANDPSSPMANYLNHLDAEGIIKGARWTRRSDLPAKVEKLRSWRNEAAHENTQIPMGVAQECHDILWKKGLMRDLCRLAVAAEAPSR